MFWILGNFVFIQSTEGLFFKGDIEVIRVRGRSKLEFGGQWCERTQAISIRGWSSIIENNYSINIMWFGDNGLKAPNNCH